MPHLQRELRCSSSDDLLQFISSLNLENKLSALELEDEIKRSRLVGKSKHLHGVIDTQGHLLILCGINVPEHGPLV